MCGNLLDVTFFLKETNPAFQLEPNCDSELHIATDSFQTLAWMIVKSKLVPADHEGPEGKRSFSEKLVCEGVIYKMSAF